MAYRRPNPEKPKAPHILLQNFGGLGELTLMHDSPWIADALKKNHCELDIALTQLKEVIERVKGLDLSDFKEEVALKKRSEPLLAARRALLTFIKKQVAEAQADLDATSAKILRATDPERPSDASKAMLAELKYQEQRSLLRAMPPEQRAAFLGAHPNFLPALVDSPDEIISKEHLLELRREHAFNTDPSLQMEENDSIILYKAVRKRVGEVNACAVKMLLKEKLEGAAEISPIEHFEAMPPQTQFEHAQAMKRIASWQRQQFDAEQKRKFMEANPGVDLDQDAGVRRPRNAQQADQDKALRRGRSEA